MTSKEVYEKLESLGGSDKDCMITCCMPLEVLPKGRQSKTATVHKCDCCGTKIWLSVGEQEKNLKHHGLKKAVNICMFCLRKHTDYANSKGDNLRVVSNVNSGIGQKDTVMIEKVLSEEIGATYDDPTLNN